MSSTTIEKNTVEPPIGAKVRHDKLGAGEVTGVGDSQATVMFGDGITARVPVEQLDWEGKMAPSVDDEPTTAIGSLVQQIDGRYLVIGKDDARHLSDFVFTVDARIYIDGDESDLIFAVSANGKQLDELPATLFSQPAKFQAYLNRQGLSWDGTLRDLKGLFYLLKEVDAPVKTGVTATGLHGATWVLPDETFGPDADKYHVRSVCLQRPAAIPPAARWRRLRSLRSLRRGGETPYSRSHHSHTGLDGRGAAPLAVPSVPYLGGHGRIRLGKDDPDRDDPGVFRVHHGRQVPSAAQGFDAAGGQRLGRSVQRFPGLV